MTSQGCFALTMVPTNPARVTILWRKVFWIKVTFASISVFGHFVANRAGKSTSGEPAQVLSGQILQPGGLLCLPWISAWNHQGQFHFRPPGSGLPAYQKNLNFLYCLFRSEFSSWEHGSLTDGTPARVESCRTGCRCHKCNQEKNSASPQSGF